MDFKKRMPPLSVTEREALAAGDVWWEKELFSGQPQWQHLLAMPVSQLTSEEESFLKNQVETLCNMIDDWQIVYHEHDLPKAVWDYLKKERFFGLVIPKQYGGLGFSALAHSTVVVKIASRSVSVAINTMVPNSLGPGELLLHYGTQQQKSYYLPRLASGEEIPCFGLTEPRAGSDAGSLTDSGIVCHGEYQGKQVLGIRLSWEKRYITLAPIATVLGIAFHLYDPDHLLSTKEDIGITLSLIPTNHKGVEIGNRHLPSYLAFMNGPTRGKDVFIPMEWIIGGVEMAGQGWRMLMECLSIGRAISLPALSTACGKMTFRMTGAYAQLRKQFNMPIAQFEGVEEALANMAGYTYLLEACRLLTVSAIDQKIKPATASAIAKYQMTELARKVISHAMDIHGGHAVQVGPRNYLAHAHLSTPISITVEGANILTRNMIIFGQGAIRCHPYILQEIELINGPAVSSQGLRRILFSHAGYLIKNIFRSFYYGLTAGKLISVSISGPTARYYRQLTRMSTALALLADSLMLILGGKLKRKECISARLADILSELYLASAALKYAQQHHHAKEDLTYLSWCIPMCLYNIQTACEGLFANFPWPWLGKILSWLIFPWGRSYKKPKDNLAQHMVKIMTVPSEFRDRLTCYAYTNTDAAKKLEAALSQVAAIDPIWKKFQSAMRDGKVKKWRNVEEQMQEALKQNILTASEVNALCEYDKLITEIIKVDEFSFDLRKVV